MVLEFLINLLELLVRGNIDYCCETLGSCVKAISRLFEITAELLRGCLSTGMEQFRSFDIELDEFFVNIDKGLYKSQKKAQNGYAEAEFGIEDGDREDAGNMFGIHAPGLNVLGMGRMITS